MMRKTVISTLTAVLVLTGSVLGLAGGASAAVVAEAPAPSSSAAIPEQGVVQQLADSLAEGLQLHGRRGKLKQHNRLWQHGPSTGPGSTAHIVIRLASGGVLGVNDVQFSEPAQAPHQFYLTLPDARKLLKKKKHPTLVADVTYYGPAGEVLSASQHTKL